MIICDGAECKKRTAEEVKVRGLTMLRELNKNGNEKTKRWPDERVGKLVTMRFKLKELKE